VQLLNFALQFGDLRFFTGSLGITGRNSERFITLDAVGHHCPVTVDFVFGIWRFDIKIA